jgi:capsular polysaccharide biosynthesis protein
MEETISLQDIFKTIKKRLVMIIVITLAATMVSALVTYFFITPQYEASTQILVNQASDAQSQYNLNQIQTNVQYINTYSVIIESPTVLKSVIDKLNLDMTTNDLKNILTVNSEQNSQVFTVAVQDADPTQAVKIANTIASVFKDKVPKLMNVNNVSILSKAQLSNDASPVSPKPKLNMAIAFVVGLMVSIGIAFLLEYLDNTVKTEEDIESFLELPFLGAIAETKFEDVNLLPAKRTRSKVGGERIEA